MSKFQNRSGDSLIERSFRDLSAEEIDDPERLDALDAMELGGRFAWPDLLGSSRVLILSAAGAGKTHECRETAKRLFADGHSAFFLTLEGIASSDLSLLLDRVQAERFRQWLSDGHSQGYFFLDSADELLLSHGDFRQALRKFAVAIDGQLHRARIFVTSRPIALDLEAFASELPVVPPLPPPDIVEDPDAEFRRLISGETRKQHNRNEKNAGTGEAQPGVRVVGLTSLSRAQIEQLAAISGVKDRPALIAEIDRKRAWEFARRPQELIEICSYWNEHKRLGTRFEQIAEDIRRKLQETGDRKRHVRLSDAKALEGAERLALAQVLTRKRTIRFSDLSMDADEREAAIDPSIILADWPQNERSELLQRPLFGFASYGRVRFQHRSASEYLAAQRLHRLTRAGQMSRSALLRLLFGQCYGQQLLFPSMRAVAAWLAISDDAVRGEVLRREPEALMDDGDPESFPVSTRSQILSAYAARYGKDDWRGVRIPYPQVLRFASPDLSPVVRKLWAEDSSSPEVRELLIDLIQAGGMEDCLDIATAVAHDASATPTDRITAVTGLAEMSARGALEPLVTSLLSQTHWSSRVKEGVIDCLFPKHMSVEQFTQLLGQIEVDNRSVGGLDYTLPRLIPQMELPGDKIALLRASLSELIEDSIKKSDSWPHYESIYRHLSSALAALCLREIKGTQLPKGLIEAAVIATRLRDNEYGDEKPVAELTDCICGAPPAWRKAAYVAEGRFCAAYIPSRSDDEFGFNIAYGSMVATLGHDDFGWLVEIAADPIIERTIRASAFRDALYMLRRDGVPVKEREAALRDAAKGEPVWLEKLEQWLVPAQPNKEREAREAKYQKEAEQRKAKEQKAVDSWVTWRDGILRDPDAYFAKTSLSKIVWDFAQVLERDPEQGGWRARWNQAPIATHFNEEIAARVSEAFCAYWCTIDVPLRSERAEDQRNTIWSSWIHALAGVYAEAERPDWALGLSREEAERAARLATVELNGLPPWIGALIAHQPTTVDAMLGQELSSQLDDAVAFEFPRLISDLAQADHKVLEFFAPRVWHWLLTTQARFDGEQEQARMHDHLERAIDFVLRSSIDRSELSTLAEQRLAQGLGEPFALLWLMLLFSTQPQAAIEHLEQHVDALEPSARYRLSEGLFAHFGDRRSARFCADLSDPRFTPETLLRLVRFAYAEIRLADDLDRLGGGAYSPTARDEAQDGRGAVLSALLARTGPAAWAIKQAMRSDPLFAHFKDRLDQMAREKAASEAEGLPLADRDLAQIDALGEAPQVDRNGMFQLMIDRLADLQHDIAAHEFSERAILIGISHEKNMQVWFAKRLQERENDAYRVDREALVINDKETDIRLLSVRSNAQAVIEMKLANNGYSITDLEKALEVQLAGQYMQHEHCRAGCLLITMNKPRFWLCPQTQKKLDFAAVIARLQSQATDLELRMNHEVRLAVVGIDLTIAAATIP
jgi:hypothetical protein